MKLLRFFQGYERIPWSIAGVIVGSVIAIFLTDVTENEKIAAIAVGLLVTIIFIQVGDLAQSNRIGELLGSYHKLRQDRILLILVEELIDYYLKGRDYENEFISARADEILKFCLDELSYLADGRLKVEAYEDLVYTIKGMDLCKEAMRVSSWQDSIDYWHSPQGRAYLQKQQDFLKLRDGNKVVRVFILHEKDLQAYKQILFEQSGVGIEVRIANADAIPSQCLEAYIIYDNYSVRIEKLVSGINKSAIFSIDENEVRGYARKFDELYLRSDSLNQIFPNESFGDK